MIGRWGVNGGGGGERGYEAGEGNGDLEGGRGNKRTADEGTMMLGIGVRGC